MTDHHAERLLDALQAYTVTDAADSQRVLVVGARGNAGFVAALLDVYPQATITVIDHRAEDAQTFAETVAADHDRITSVAGGLVDLADLAPGPYDRIISRHPDITMGRSAWHYGLQACVGQLSDDGLLIATTADLADAGFIHDLMTDQGLHMIPGTPFTAVPVAMGGTDRYILIYAPGEPETHHGG